MALKVSTTPRYTGVLKVNTAPKNYIVPQQPRLQPTAPSPQKTYNPQPKTYNPQPTAPAAAVQPAYTPPAPTAAQIAEAARQRQLEVQRQAAIKAEQLRVQVQGKVDNLVAKNTVTNKLRVSTAVGRNYSPTRLKVKTTPEQDYDAIKAHARRQAESLIDSRKDRQSTGRVDDFFDKITFGADRRALSARKYAGEEASKFADRQITAYEKRLDDHMKLIAQLQADFERRRLSMNPTEANSLAKQYEEQIADSLKQVNYQAAYIEGTLEAYNIKSSEKLTSLTAQYFGTMNDKILSPAMDTKVFKYTLGEGSKTIPSIVTAPSRAVNYVGNVINKDRTIYKTGGGQTNRAETGESAWEATFGQRNINLKPYEGDSSIRRFANSVTEFAADPLTLAAPAKALKGAAKGTKFAQTAAGIARGNKYTGSILKATDKIGEAKKVLASTVKDNKIVQFLNAEYKTPEELLSEAIDIAKKSKVEKQEDLLKQIKVLNNQLAKPNQLDISIFDDLATLTDSEAKAFQRIVNGQLNYKDRIRLVGKANAPTRQKIESIAAKWQDFAEKMKLADNVQKTRFGKGKRIYTPRTTHLKKDKTLLEQYDFRKGKKDLRPNQSAEELRSSAIDRYFASNLDESFANTENVQRRYAYNKRKDLVKQYDAEVDRVSQIVQDAYSRVNSKSNKVRKAAGAPNRLWKKSVLKYRPAWTVNNVAYNTQAGFLASGRRFAVEQSKMLKPEYARKAMAQVPDSVKTKLAKETGYNGKLNKMYQDIENNQRIAAYLAAVKSGKSPEEALKRVNKYFFDYTTKNYERPIKAVIPFWAFQKNIAKASAQMPFDRPIAAKVYNSLDKNEQIQFDKEFDTIVDELKDYGYSDQEIAEIREQQSVYYANRTKIAGKYFSTPFNGFSEDTVSGLGINPYLGALTETFTGKDNFGRDIDPEDSGFRDRLISKFPQLQLGKDAKRKYVDNFTKSEKYIGAPGSDGFGYTKEKQGSDPSKANYTPSLDKTKNFSSNLAAYAGKPRGLDFDTDELLERKKITKLTQEYFKNNPAWSKLSFDKANQKREELFASYGLTADDFYKGILAKYDTDHTKGIKELKDEARQKNKDLFEQYNAQDKYDRNIWATDKIRELAESGYFDSNPFLKTFDWINKESQDRADKQKSIRAAIESGDWTGYRKQYGGKSSPYQYNGKYFKSQETMDRYVRGDIVRRANETGDWTEYREKYGSKETPFSYQGKYFKSQQTMDSYKEGKFWEAYSSATKDERKKMLEENPQYNKRKDWTAADWDKWRSDRKAQLKKDFVGYANNENAYKRLLEKNKLAAKRVDNIRSYRRKTRKVAYVR